jgi:predicted DCC family thiol-disulfide oxidoreductase YuxK
MLKIMSNKYIIIFDGVCNFCNRAINFIIKHDPNEKFAFIPMQTELASSLAKKCNINNVGLNTILLVKNGRCYMWSDAVLEISKDLSGCWYLFNIMKIIPRPIRDFFYKLFARNRYKLFGKRNVCMVPTDEVKRRFVGFKK